MQGSVIFVEVIVVKHMHYVFNAALLLLVTSCGGYTNAWVPMVSRPDTRSILGINVDTVYMQQIVTHMIEARPNEIAFCLYGTVKWDWSPENGTRMGLVTVNRVTVAKMLEVTPRKVLFPKQPRSGCIWEEGLLGIAHDHPEPTRGLCKQSDNDSSLLLEDKRVLFAMTLCANGTGEVLWQDGRRHAFIWYDPE